MNNEVLASQRRHKTGASGASEARAPGPGPRAFRAPLEIIFENEMIYV